MMVLRFRIWKMKTICTLLIVFTILAEGKKPLWDIGHEPPDGNLRLDHNDIKYYIRLGINSVSHLREQKPAIINFPQLIEDKPVIIPVRNSAFLYNHEILLLTSFNPSTTMEFKVNPTLNHVEINPPELTTYHAIRISTNVKNQDLDQLYIFRSRQSQPQNDYDLIRCSLCLYDLNSTQDKCGQGPQIADGIVTCTLHSNMTEKRLLILYSTKIAQQILASLR